ncbi:MAG: amidase [Treponema sp.]|nr:amidase [Treponema sp.]
MRDEAANSVVEMSGWELSRAIHEKKLSCREAMRAYLDHIARVNPRVNAVVALRDGEALLAEADLKDALLARGEDGGWMCGFPQAVKDMEETRGIVTTYGYRGFRDFVPDFDGFVARRLKEAGSVLIGKTNTPEWGLGSNTYNEVYGATGNPYDHALTSGGSSGGTACALAMRMQAVADGSDYMGSLRNPAGFCNVYGFRPSWGRVPNSGKDLFLNTFTTRGPMARNVADLALLLATLAGYDEKIPLSLADDADLASLNPRNVRDRLKTDLRGKKIAWLGDWNGYLPMEAGVLETCEKALESFSPLGVAVRPLPPPYDPAVLWNEVWLPLRHFTSQSLRPFYDDPEKRALLKPEAVYEYEGGKRYGPADVYFAGIKRGEWFLALLKVFEEYDYVAVPTAQVFPFDKTVRWPAEIAGKKMDSYHRWMEVVIPWTLSACPVVAVPAGFREGPNGELPMGIQIVGKPRGDFDLLRLAAAYESCKDWVGTRKPAYA